MNLFNPWYLKLKNMKKFVLSLVLVLSAMTVEAQDIFAAARANNVEELKNLVANKVDINQENQQGFTPLILAVYNNSLEATQFLIKNGANVNAQDKSGNTALMGAIFKGHKDLVAILINAKANINQVNGNNASALIFGATFGKAAIIKMLLNAGADKTIKDNTGKTALDHALIQENIEVIDLLK